MDMNSPSPSLLVINGQVYRRGSFQNDWNFEKSNPKELTLIGDTGLHRMILPGETESNEEQVKVIHRDRLRQKWVKLSKLLYAVSSFQNVPTDGKIPVSFRARSWSDPELENRIRKEDINMLMMVERPDTSTL